MNRNAFIIMLGVAILGIAVFLASQSNAKTSYSPISAEAVVSNGVQEVSLRALGTGLYDKSEIVVKKDIPVRMHFTAEADAACGRQLIMRDFGVNLISENGEEKIAVFTPTEEGTFEYRCPMRMFHGKLRVVS